MVYEDFEYDKETLRFLRSLLDEHAIEVFREVIRHQKNNGYGLQKTKLDQYRKFRFKYDLSISQLEAQGFIEAKDIATTKPYIVTTRGLQLVALLKQEKQSIDSLQIEGGTTK